MTNVSTHIDWDGRAAYTLYQGSPTSGQITSSAGLLGLSGLFAGLVDVKGQFVLAPTISVDGINTTGITEFVSSFGYPNACTSGLPISLGLKVEGTGLITYATGVAPKGHWTPTINGHLTNKSIYVSRGLNVPWVTISRTGSNWVEATGAYIKSLYYGTGVVGDMIFAEEGPNSGKLYRITGQGAGYASTPGTTFYLEGYTGGGLVSGHRISIWYQRTVTGENAGFYLYDKKSTDHPTYPNTTSFANSLLYINAGQAQSGYDVDGVRGYRISGARLTGIDGTVYSGQLRAGDYVAIITGTAQYVPGDTFTTYLIKGAVSAGAFDYFYYGFSGQNAEDELEVTPLMNTGAPITFYRTNHYYVDNAPTIGKTYSSIVYSGYLPSGLSTPWPMSPFSGATRLTVNKLLGMDKLVHEDVKFDYSFNEYDSNVTSIGSRAHFHLGPLYYGNDLLLSGISGCRASLISPQSTGFNTLKVWDVPATWNITTKSGAAQDGSYYDPTRGVFVMTYTAGIQFDQARTYTLAVELVVNGQIIKRVIPVPTQPPI